MPTGSHKTAFPDKAAVAAFVKGLRPTHQAMYRELTRGGMDLSPETVKNWYLKPPGEMEATKLLGVVIALRAQSTFFEWVARLSSGAVSLEDIPVATGFLAISPQDQEDLEAHEAVETARSGSSAAPVPSAPAPDASSRLPARSAARGGKGKAR